MFKVSRDNFLTQVSEIHFSSSVDFSMLGPYLQEDNERTSYTKWSYYTAKNNFQATKQDPEDYKPIHINSMIARTPLWSYKD